MKPNNSKEHNVIRKKKSRRTKKAKEAERVVNAQKMWDKLGKFWSPPM